MAPRQQSAWASTPSSYFNEPSRNANNFLSSWSVSPDWQKEYFSKDSSPIYNVKSDMWDKSFGQYRDSEQSYLNKVKTDLFDKASSRKWFSEDSEKQSGRSGSYPFGGEWSKGSGGQVLENLGVVYPQQHSPMFIPGVEGKKSGLFGQAGGLAGALGSAFGIFGPLGAPIGAAVGGLVDTAIG